MCVVYQQRGIQYRKAFANRILERKRHLGPFRRKGNLEEKETPKVWEEAFQEYKKYGIENPYTLSVEAIGSKARLYMENMFYMYSSRRDEAGQKYEKINYEYQCRKIRIHEKDFETVKEKIGEYEAQEIKFDWE